MSAVTQPPPPPDEASRKAAVDAAIGFVADLQNRIEAHRDAVLLAHRQLLEMLPPDMREKASKHGVADLVGVVHKKRKAWQPSSSRVVELEKQVAEMQAGRAEARARLVARLSPGVRARVADDDSVLDVLDLLDEER